MASGQTKLFAILVIVGLVAAGAFAALILLQPPADIDDGPSVVVVGRTGNSTNVTLTDLLEMDEVSRNSSYQNSYGNVRGEGNYKGILISDLVELVGGMQEIDRVTIIASDGYNQTFEYSKVYPNASIWDIQGDMVLAYEFDGQVVPEFEDGYRLMFLPEDGFYDNADANATTDPNPYAAGPQCVSNVVEIRVINMSPALVVGVEDTIQQFTMSDVTGLPSVTGEGGYKRTSGTIVGPDTFTGVTVLSLLQQVTSLPANYTMTVYSRDGWTSEYSKTMVEGTVNGYTATGDPIDSIQSTMILAYEKEGAPLETGDGPLRVVFLNEDGNLTDGSRWAKDVVNITITEVPLSGLLHQEVQSEIVRSEQSLYLLIYALVSEIHGVLTSGPSLF